MSTAQCENVALKERYVALLTILNLFDSVATVRLLRIPLTQR